MFFKLNLKPAFWRSAALCGGALLAAGAPALAETVIYPGVAGIALRTIGGNGQTFSNALAPSCAGGDDSHCKSSAVAGNTVQLNPLPPAPMPQSVFGAVNFQDQDAVTGNQVAITAGSQVASGGMVIGGLHWLAGVSAQLTASQNSVTVTNSVAPESVIYGGFVETSAEYFFNVITAVASRNKVSLVNSSVSGAVYGGGAFTIGSDITIDHNVVEISGGAVGGDVFGGYAGYNGSATDNTIQITGAPNLANANLHGGFGATSTNNLLDIVNSTGLTVRMLDRFQQIRLTLPATLKPGDTILTVTTDSAYLGENLLVTVFGWAGNLTVQPGDKFIIIDASATGIDGSVAPESSQNCQIAGHRCTIAVEGKKVVLTVAGNPDQPPPPPDDEQPPLITTHPGPHDGIYQITNADGTLGDYVSVHGNGNQMFATLYRSSGPAHAASFTLADGPATTALYRWGSWDLFDGGLAGNVATLTGYSQYGLCNASLTINFGASNTIRVTPTRLSEFAPAGTPASACDPKLGNWPTLTMKQILIAAANSTVDGIYHVTNKDGTTGDYVSVHTDAAGALIATLYRSSSPAHASSFALTDGGASVATLYRWGSWDLYNGTVAGNVSTFNGYVQYGLCKAIGSMAFSQPQSITIKPNGASQFAPAGPQPSCNLAGDGALTITRDF